MNKRNPDGTFKKGTSGNPGGRNKGIAALVKSLSNDYEDYIILLDKWVKDDTLAIKDRRACLAEILDRSMGKPTQRHEINTHNIVIGGTPEDLNVEDM